MFKTALQKLTTIEGANADEQRRGAILIALCVCFTAINLLTIPVVLAAYKFSPGQFVLWEALAAILSVTVCYVIGVQIARSGRVDQAGAFCAFCLSSIVLGTVFINGWTNFHYMGVAASLIVGVVSHRAFILPVMIYNVVGITLLAQFISYTDGPTPMSFDFLPVLLLLHLVAGGIAWIYSYTNASAFAQQLELARSLEEARRLETLSRQNAEDASKAKSSFLAGMSHELRTPLNAVIGYSEMIYEELLEDGRSKEDMLMQDVQKINTSGRHLLSMINDVLDLSKIEAGHLEIHPEAFDLTDFMEEVHDVISPMTDRNHNALEIDIRAHHATIHTDRTRLRQILLNLLSNAAKFTTRGHITFGVESDTLGGIDAYRFTVTDTGIGMTEEQLSRIFKPFEQAEETTTRRYGGTGLGLTLTATMTELLGGRIETESTPGEGSIFRIILPSSVDDPLPEASH